MTTPWQAYMLAETKQHNASPDSWDSAIMQFDETTHPDHAWWDEIVASIGTVDLADCIDIPALVVRDDVCEKQFTARHTFNGSIVMHKGSTLLFFRVDGPIPWLRKAPWAVMSTVWVAPIVRAAGQMRYTPATPPTRIDFPVDGFVPQIGAEVICQQTGLPYPYVPRGTRIEDPRAFVDGQGRLRLNYGNGVAVYSALLSDDGQQVISTACLGGDASNVEKNYVGWVGDDGNSYVTQWTTATRHVVWRLGNTQVVRRPTITEHSLPASWFADGYTGPHGGCVTEYDAEHHLHLFNCQRRNKAGAIAYVVGALLFRRAAPFNVVACTTLPLWKAVQIPAHIPRMNRRASIVYAAGAVVQERDAHDRPSEWLVSLGFNDYKVALVTLRRSDLKFVAHVSVNDE